MDGARFDRWTRLLAADPASRRAALRLLAGGGAAAVLARLGLEGAAAACAGLGQTCTHDGACCSGACSTDRRGSEPDYRCCQPAGKKAKKASQCCSGKRSRSTGKCTCIKTGASTACDPAKPHQCCSGFCGPDRTCAACSADAQCPQPDPATRGYAAARCDTAAGGVCRYQPKGGGVECRAKADLCDAAEACDGTALACPPDRLEPEGTKCRAADPHNACSAAAYCTGDSPACPETWAEQWTPCNPGLGECVEGYCDGAGGCAEYYLDGMSCTIPPGMYGICCYGMCTLEEEGIC